MLLSLAIRSQMKLGPFFTYMPLLVGNSRLKVHVCKSLFPIQWITTSFMVSDECLYVVSVACSE